MKQSSSARNSVTFVNFRTPDATGAPTGTTLRGVRRDDKDIEKPTHAAVASVDGVVLKVAQGNVFPYTFASEKASGEYNTTADPRGWAKRISEHTGVTPDVAQQQLDRLSAQAITSGHAMLGYAGSHNVNVKNPNRCPTHGFNGEAPLRFKIISAGVWGSVSERVRSWEASQELVDPVDLLVELRNVYDADNECGVGPLALRPNLFLQAKSSEKLSGVPAVIDVNVHGAIVDVRAPIEYYSIEANANTTIVVAMPQSGTKPFDSDEVADVAERTVRGIDFGRDDEGRAQVDAAFAVLNGPKVGFGFLKSVIQKLARVRAKNVVLPGFVEAVDARIVMAVAVGLLCSTKGDGFVPDLGLFVRGPTAALKRLGVIAVEDALPGKAIMNTGGTVVALMAAALVTVRVPGYNATPALVMGCMHVGLRMLEHHNLVQWREPRRLAREVAVPCHEVHMFMAARLLRVLRSFEGDMSMLDTATLLCARIGNGTTVPCIQADIEISSTIPLYHAIDQHVFRGIGHVSIDGPPTFAKRFSEIFSRVSGFNPRISQSNLDESDQVVKRVRFQQRCVSIGLFGLSVPFDNATQLQQRELSLQIDAGVLAAGVNGIPVTVNTTVAENATDVYVTPGSTTWRLLVVIGVESHNPVVIHQWSAHVAENAKKAAITATATAKAIAAANTVSTRRFKSTMLPDYNRADLRDGDWFVTSPRPELPDIEWSWDEPPMVSIPFTEFSLPPLPLLRDNRAVARFLAENPSGLGLSNKLDVELKEILYQVGQIAVDSLGIDRRVVQLRLLSMLRQQYTKVHMPVPGLGGGLGSDEVAAEPGDWIVWRGLLWISHIAPGALRPTSIPNFNVVDARLLRHVEARIAILLKSAPEPSWKSTFTVLANGLETSFGTPAVGGRKPFAYQTSLARNMLRRDERAVVQVPSHFCSLATGLGKSLIGIWYALSHLRDHGDAKRILWFTPQAVVPTAFTELSVTWGLGSAVKVVDRAAPAFDSSINIVGVEWLSSGTAREVLYENLIQVAPTSFCVLDEVHKYYTTCIRNSTLRRVASVSPKFLSMTATPIAGPSLKLAIEWLRDSVGFPIDTTNQLVASAMMIAARVDLGVEEVDVITYANFSPEAADEHLRALRDGRRNWPLAAFIARQAAHHQLVKTAIELATADRAAHPSGGVLVICDSAADKQMVVASLEARVGAAAIGDRNTQTEHDATKAYIVTTKTDVAGYSLTRLGAVVSGVYASNAASRKQLRGRIKRIGQLRKLVTYDTVVTKHSILQLLLNRHSSVDAKNESLADLAEVFVAGGA